MRQITLIKFADDTLEGRKQDNHQIHQVTHYSRHPMSCFSKSTQFDFVACPPV